MCEQDLGVVDFWRKGCVMQCDKTFGHQCDLNSWADCQAKRSDCRQACDTKQEAALACQSDWDACTNVCKSRGGIHSARTPPGAHPQCMAEKEKCLTDDHVLDFKENECVDKCKVLNDSDTLKQCEVTCNSKSTAEERDKCRFGCSGSLNACRTDCHSEQLKARRCNTRYEECANTCKA